MKEFLADACVTFWRRVGIERGQRLETPDNEPTQEDRQRNLRVAATGR